MKKEFTEKQLQKYFSNDKIMKWLDEIDAEYFPHAKETFGVWINEARLRGSNDGEIFIMFKTISDVEIRSKSVCIENEETIEETLFEAFVDATKQLCLCLAFMASIVDKDLRIDVDRLERSNTH